MVNSIRWRIQLWHGLILLVVVVSFGTLLYVRLYRARFDEVNTELQGAAQVFIGLLAEGWSDAFTSRGWASESDIQEMREAWLRFAAFPGALFVAAWCVAVAWKGNQTTEV